MNAVSDDIRRELRSRVEREMEDLKITNFEVKIDQDHDGDAILRIEVVYDEAGGAPRVSRMSSLTRSLRPWLETQIPNTFPVLRFLTAGELADEAH